MSFFTNFTQRFKTYFDTDEVVEEEKKVAVQSKQLRRSSSEPSRQPKIENPRQYQPVSENRDQQIPPVRESVKPISYRGQNNLEQNLEEKSKIALKYPRQYEDAPEIVNLLLMNESVLIDFQYMLDAPARRCLDYLSGASSVLGGNLQKVGSSMYLLTPSYVVVNIEDLGIEAHRRSEGVSFDYDMKRR